jgi:NAD(P)-dependent dehydrogenase (short-subunit alcohol dehydrogenase family)
LVTGSTSGIGAAIAQSLAREGVTVVINGRSQERAGLIGDRITQAGGITHLAVGDLRSDDGARSIIDQALAATGQIDILVNNAGVSRTEGKKSFFDTPVTEWQETLNDNLMTAVRMIQGLVPSMRERGWGRVIQISSRNAISPYPHLPSYAASKAAMNNLTLSLSKELAFSGVTVNAVMPGVIHTPMIDKAMIELAKQQGWDGDIDRTTQHFIMNVCRQTVKRLGEGEDIAGYVCFLASPHSDFLTGTVLRVDGGSTPTL